MDHMSWITHCRRIDFGLAVAMVLTEHLGAQENKAVSPLLPPRPAATDAVHDIPLCGDSAQYVHQIPSTSMTHYLPILIQPSRTSTSPNSLSPHPALGMNPSPSLLLRPSGSGFFLR
jgi:hypothetical protein